MIDIKNLTNTDIGRKVIYERKYHHQEKEEGELSSWNDKYVFVRFRGPTIQACKPTDVRFSIPMIDIIENLRREACKEGREWAEQYSPAEAWERCPRPDWLRWTLKKLGLLHPAKDRLFACRCVRETPLPDGRKVWDLLTDERSRNAVEVAERYARGEAAKEELDAAWTAALIVALNADNEAAEWNAATRAAARTAVGDARYAARDSANTACDVADAMGGANAMDAAMAAQADLLRQIYPCPFNEDEP